MLLYDQGVLLYDWDRSLDVISGFRIGPSTAGNSAGILIPV
jgi:hypothetical protein